MPLERPAEVERALDACAGAVHASPGHLSSYGYVLIWLMRLGRTQELAIALQRTG